MLIALIDYQAGNLTSVRKALTTLGAEVYTPLSPEDLEKAEGIIVPGVGHFEATAALHDGWHGAIRWHISEGKTLLGICLGMQWLYEGSSEAPDLRGLGVLPGFCGRLGPEWIREATDAAAWESYKVPHVGWNSVRAIRPSTLLHGVAPDAQAYFTHSYAAPAQCSVATTTHGPATFASAVEDGPVFGMQFHPEKSGDVGLTMLRNFLARTRGERVALAGPVTGGVERAVASKRIIACLDVRDGAVVKGVKFEGLRTAGDPAELAARYNAEGIDEVVILDVTATLESRRALARTIGDVARRLFIPLAVGGGIRSEDDAAAVVDAGADKVSLNTAALVDPDLITRLAVRYGSQAVVVAIDAKRQPLPAGGDGFAVYSRSGSQDATRQAVEWAQEAASRGAGEILLTSIDKDGTRSGFDCELTAAVSSAVSIPVIASGGAGELDHFVDVFTRGRADAALAASIFHFAEKGVTALKTHLAAAGIPVRQGHGSPLQDGL
jgi:imidazole glycerol-phosphate synthase subunit HisF